jgi:LPXTG-motif cell wall-anchored protein
MQGFQVYSYVWEVPDGYSRDPDPSMQKWKWFFYTWDEEQRKYVEVEEVDRRYIGLEAGQEPESPAVAPIEASAPAVPQSQTTVAAAELPPVETAYSAAEGSSPGGQFSLIIILIGGAVVLGVAVILLVKRKKKR